MPQTISTTQAIITLVSILMAAYLYHFFTERRASKETFNTAAKEFVDAFKEFHAMLETNFQYEIGHIKAPIPDHIAAAIVFRQHLGWFLRKCFNRKLAQYKQCAKEYQNIEQHIGLENIPHDISLKLIKLIDALLKYAKHK